MGKAISEKKNAASYHKNRNVGKNISEKKNAAAITKTETWAKLSQKRRMPPLSQKLKRGQRHLRK
jgi:hypothetical protein